MKSWRESHLENIRCSNFITERINQNYDGHRLGGDVARDAIARYGYDRINWVLANTIQRSGYDERFSAANVDWAHCVYIPPGDNDWEYRAEFAVQCHPGLVDIVTNQARQAYDQLRLFDVKRCYSVYDYVTVADQVLVLKPEMLKDEYKTPEHQLFLAEYGNGCRPDAIGRSIFGKFLIDGEKDRYYRQDFLGVLKPDFLPEWAMEKMEALELGQAKEPVLMEEAPGNMEMKFHGP